MPAFGRTLSTGRRPLSVSLQGRLQNFTRSENTSPGEEPGTPDRHEEAW